MQLGMGDVAWLEELISDDCDRPSERNGRTRRTVGAYLSFASRPRNSQSEIGLGNSEWAKSAVVAREGDVVGDMAWTKRQIRMMGISSTELRSWLCFFRETIGPSRVFVKNLC
jgi:hypothetical protein